MSSLTITPWSMEQCGEVELAAVVAMLRSSMAEKEPPERRSAHRTRRLLERWLSTGRTGVVVARGKGRAVLGVCVVRSEPPSVRVVYICARYPRRGCGRALIERVEEIAAKHGIGEVRATINPDDKVQRGFFLSRLGFALERGEPVDEVEGIPHFDCVLLLDEAASQLSLSGMARDVGASGVMEMPDLTGAEGAPPAPGGPPGEAPGGEAPGRDPQAAEPFDETPSGTDSTIPLLSRPQPEGTIRITRDEIGMPGPIERAAAAWPSLAGAAVGSQARRGGALPEPLAEAGADPRHAPDRQAGADAGSGSGSDSGAGSASGSDSGSDSDALADSEDADDEPNLHDIDSFVASLTERSRLPALDVGPESTERVPVSRHDDDSNDGDDDAPREDDPGAQTVPPLTPPSGPAPGERGDEPPARPLVREAARAVVISGETKRRIALGDRDTYAIGRAPDVDITVVGKKTSRHHCDLLWDRDRLYVRDRGSSNGTFLNGRRVDVAEVREGDVLSIGRTRIGFDNLAVRSLPVEIAGKLAEADAGDTVVTERRRLKALMPGSAGAGASDLVNSLQETIHDLRRSLEEQATKLHALEAVAEAARQQATKADKELERERDERRRAERDLEAERALRTGLEQVLAEALVAGNLSGSEAEGLLGQVRQTAERREEARRTIERMGDALGDLEASLDALAALETTIGKSEHLRALLARLRGSG